jgi:hypothetical protein
MLTRLTVHSGICKLFCTREGILVNRTIINKDLLWHWLEKLEGVDWADDTLFTLLNPKATTSQNLDSLLNPKDPQDVCYGPRPDGLGVNGTCTISDNIWCGRTPEHGEVDHIVWDGGEWVAQRGREGVNQQRGSEQMLPGCWVTGDEMHG